MTDSFSFEAGSSDRSGLRAKTTRPDESSTTIAVDEDETHPGHAERPGQAGVQASRTGARRAGGEQEEQSRDCEDLAPHHSRILRDAPAPYLAS